MSMQRNEGIGQTGEREQEDRVLAKRRETMGGDVSVTSWRPTTG